MIKAVFEGIGEQVGHHLVELSAVYPGHDGCLGSRADGEVDVSLAGIILVDLVDGQQEGVHIGFLTVQLHLLLVYLANVQNLVDQSEYALCIAVDGVNGGILLL